MSDAPEKELYETFLEAAAKKAGIKIEITTPWEERGIEIFATPETDDAEKIRDFDRMIGALETNHEFSDSHSRINRNDEQNTQNLGIRIANVRGAEHANSIIRRHYAAALRIPGEVYAAAIKANKMPFHSWEKDEINLIELALKQ